MPQNAVLSKLSGARLSNNCGSRTEQNRYVCNIPLNPDSDNESFVCVVVLLFVYVDIRLNPGLVKLFHYLFT